MRKSFEVGAETRDDQGKGASRRLRRAGKVPAILYGGKGEASNITLNQLKLLNLIEDEKFYSSVITLKVDGKDQQAIVKDVQLHPADSLPERDHLPGCEDPGWPGVASAHRCGNLLPAEGSA
jgi:large subunit ribosomal protein L25